MIAWPFAVGGVAFIIIAALVGVAWKIKGWCKEKAGLSRPQHGKKGGGCACLSGKRPQSLYNLKEVMEK